MTDWAAPESTPHVDAVDGASESAESLRSRRVQYETSGLDVADVDADPVVQWSRWHQDAYAGGAMTVSTIGLDAAPDSRVVLVREADRRGLVFYTNYASAKSRQLDAAPVAAAVFSWLDLHRQVRLRARVERVAAEESEAYFASRPRGSQLGAWASSQSDVIADREELEALVAEFDARFADAPIPRPPHWGDSYRSSGSSGKAARTACMIASASAGPTVHQVRGKSTASPPSQPNSRPKPEI